MPGRLGPFPVSVTPHLVRGSAFLLPLMPGQSRHPTPILARRPGLDPGLASFLHPPQSPAMPKRTAPADAHDITQADDLQHAVHDKREGWRANPTKARSS